MAAGVWRHYDGYTKTTYVDIGAHGALIPRRTGHANDLTTRLHKLSRRWTPPAGRR